MSHWIIAPVLLPAIIAGLLVLSMRHHLGLQRVFSLGGAGVLVAIAMGLAAQAASGAVGVYELGGWPAPFGIVLVLDRLSALMVLLTTVLAVAVLLYAIGANWDARGAHFHALYHFQLMGILGAFLTGDLFNLFVFFEVLLIASYGLVIHAGGARRMRAGVQYVVYNLLGSTLFLFALGTLYGVTGTLNMADMAERVAAIPTEDTALLRVGAVLLLSVFAVKAAILPLHFWLPETYAAAPAPVAALFAIMTKVGAYAILRVDTLIFGPDVTATAGILSGLLLFTALITLAVGMIGILGADGLGRLAAFATVGSVGTLLAGLALFTPETTVAALYYTIHSTLAGALLFLVVDMVRERRGAAGDALVSAPPIAAGGMIAALWFGAAIATAGMPPLSGFVGKLLILDAVRGDDWMWLIWTVVLASSLLAILGLAQAGSQIFWKTTEPAQVAGDAPAEAPPPLALPAVAAFTLIGAIVGLTVFAAPVVAYLEATAGQLYDPSDYIAAVLGPEAPEIPPAPDGTGEGAPTASAAPQDEGGA
ncbi:monovalent cation/H+ antiporter subunit D [Rhodosalinus halophilus]|uniref:Monovalent cation/H+ antiporter subunit D n=1 Tax=Rhodosalinus halophilus TaxID=2259333 RepID=A0A365UDU3_9RHOB|nr:monovalent cation/H+ antiporter subunit D [Rhodosalinus halophilus]RBI87542.1 monovalent cation/H+ antiporter subunit D [Rhodosalinus halophilus]